VLEDSSSMKVLLRCNPKVFLNVYSYISEKRSPYFVLMFEIVLFFQQ
jgi:hypothetical protein